MRRLRLALPFALVLVLAACGPHTDIPGFPSHKPPGITIVSPADGAKVSSSSAWLQVETTGIKLSSDTAGNLTGDGSYHVYLDGNAIGTSTLPRFLVSELAPGPHSIAVRLFGLDGTPIPGTTSSSISVTVPPDAPQLRIVSPGNGATVNSSSVELTLNWKNYTSDQWDAFVDSVDSLPAANAQSPTWVVSGVHPGDHDVFVRLLWGPGDPVDPPVLDRIRVHIPELAPAVSIAAPASGATVPPSPTLTVTTRNFTIDGSKAGGTNSPGVGHYHVYLDGYDASHMWQEGYYPTITLDHLDVGEHDLYVRLMNNDHTSIEPKVVSWVHLHVTAN